MSEGILLDGEEMELVRHCLFRCRSELDAQIEGKQNYFQVTGMAWHASRHFKAKVDRLLSRIEDHRAGKSIGTAE